MNHLATGDSSLIGHGHQGHIEFTGIQTRQILFARANHNVNQHGRVGSGKFRQNVRQNPGANIVGSANTHFPLEGWRKEMLHGLFIKA